MLITDPAVGRMDAPELKGWELSQLGFVAEGLSAAGKRGQFWKRPSSARIAKFTTVGLLLVCPVWEIVMQFSEANTMYLHCRCPRGQIQDQVQSTDPYTEEAASRWLGPNDWG